LVVWFEHLFWEDMMRSAQVIARLVKFAIIGFLVSGLLLLGLLRAPELLSATPVMRWAEFILVIALSLSGVVILLQSGLTVLCWAREEVELLRARSRAKSHLHRLDARECDILHQCCQASTVRQAQRLDALDDAVEMLQSLGIIRQTSLLPVDPSAPGLVYTYRMPEWVLRYLEKHQDLVAGSE